MKVIESAILSSRIVNGKEIHYLKIREYNRDGQYEEAELFCRLTKKVADMVADTNDININIIDSFYTVDKYYKGEVEYRKPTLVLKEIEIV